MSHIEELTAKMIARTENNTTAIPTDTRERASLFHLPVKYRTKPANANSRPNGMPKESGILESPLEHLTRFYWLESAWIQSALLTSHDPDKMAHRGYTILAQGK